MCCCAKTKKAKFKCCGITSVVFGVILLAIGIAFPFVLKPIVNLVAQG